MREHELEIGKYYRFVACDDLATNIGIVFQVTEKRVNGHFASAEGYRGPVIYDPRHAWPKDIPFCVETHDTYEEVSNEEVTVYLLAD